MASVDGVWQTKIKTPMGARKGTLTLQSSGQVLTGTYSGDLGDSEVADGKVAGDAISCSVEATKPMRMTLGIEATVSGDEIAGTVTSPAFGSFQFSGVRA